MTDNGSRLRNYLLIGIVLAMTWLVVFNSQDILLGLWVDGRLRPSIVRLARYMGYMDPDKLVEACRKMMFEPERYGVVPWAKELQIYKFDLPIDEDYSGSDVPSVVQELGRAYVRVSDEQVEFMLLGARQRLYLTAVAEGTGARGRTKIANGLWTDAYSREGWISEWFVKEPPALPWGPNGMGPLPFEPNMMSAFLVCGCLALLSASLFLRRLARSGVAVVGGGRSVAKWAFIFCYIPLRARAEIMVSLPFEWVRYFSDWGGVPYQILLLSGYFSIVWLAFWCFRRGNKETLSILVFGVRREELGAALSRILGRECGPMSDDHEAAWSQLGTVPRRVRRLFGDTCWRLRLDRETFGSLDTRAGRVELARLAAEEMGGKMLVWGTINSGIRMLTLAALAIYFVEVSLSL